MLEPNFHPFPELSTSRILLRRIEIEDAKEIYFLRSDEKILQFVHKEPAASLKEAEDFIQFIHEAVDANHTIMWGIALQDQPGKLIGTICLWNLRNGDYRAEIGYVLDPSRWRQGIMKETMQLVTGYGFKRMGLHSIDAQIDTGNTASALLLEKTGFKKEGMFRESTFFRGQFLDTAVYSLVNSEQN